MKMVTSKRFPDRQPQMIPDEQWEQMRREGRAKLYIATEFAPLKTIIPVLTLPEIKKVGKIKLKNK